MIRKIVRPPLRALLNGFVNLYAWLRGFSFPPNYIRRWKLDMLGGLYEEETYALFHRILKPGMVVIDIGAHIGYFTRLFSKGVGEAGKVYAFEADPENFALLQQNTRGYRNVSLHNWAVTDKIGTVDFYHCDDKSGAHSTLSNVPLDFKKRKLTVPASDLDSFLAREEIGRVDVMKMDIEGGESAALRGMTETLKKTRVLITEFAPKWIEAAGSTPEAFRKTLESCGFQVSPITPLGSHTFTNLYCVKK